MRLKRRSVRGLLPVFVTLLILFEIMAYTSTVTRTQDQFFQLYVLGSTGFADNYFPKNSSSLRLGETVKWNVGVVNDMGSLQYVSIRVKLGNATINPPNDTLATASPSPLIAEFDQFILNNGTWQIPLVWQVANYTTSSGGQVTIRSIAMDNMTYSIQGPVTCESITTCNFRMIFELWTWNVETAAFQIGWISANQRQIAWLQLWFALSTYSP